MGSTLDHNNWKCNRATVHQKKGLELLDEKPWKTVNLVGLLLPSFGAGNVKRPTCQIYLSIVLVYNDVRCWEGAETMMERCWIGSVDLLQHYEPTRTLRSSSSSQLSVPRHNLEFGSRAFRISAPKIWNLLPARIRNSPSIPTFRRHLKTHYFQSAYANP